MMRRLASCLVPSLIVGCASPNTPSAPIASVGQLPQPSTTVVEPELMREVFPGVYLDAKKKTVAFEGTVAIDAHNEKTPIVYLEAIVCTKDTKEHESLIVTQAKPSHIHAALLLAGFVAGKPGTFDWTGETMLPVPPIGDRVRVWLIAQGANDDPRTWVTSLKSGETIAARMPDAHFVFAGSRERMKNGANLYDADFSGTLIGLSTFGTETIALSRLLNPDSALEEPDWIANASETPRFGTKVRVEIGIDQR